MTLHLERLPIAELDDTALGDMVAPEPDTTMYVFGAGHVGRALTAILAALPVSVVWVDERADAFPREPPRSPRFRVSDDWQREVAGAPAQSSFVVMTHDHALDLAIVEAVLRRGDLAYLGMIGSYTKRAKFTRRLAVRGIAPHLLDALRCPIGMPGVGGKTPGEIAVAVAAELLVVRGEGAAARARGATRDGRR